MLCGLKPGALNFIRKYVVWVAERWFYGGVTSNLDLASAREFVLRQKIRMVANEYTIESANGTLLAYAKQKVMAFKERVRFFSDSTKSVEVFSFQARNVMDMTSKCDVFDGHGTQIGFFSKDFGKSMLRSTWHLECASGHYQGQESSQAIALIRRFADVALPYDFAFKDAQGNPAFHIERKMTLRDSYRVTIMDPSIDGRVVAALAVALDTLQQR